jgi:hypothetical protein
VDEKIKYKKMIIIILRGMKMMEIILKKILRRMIINDEKIQI